MKRLVFSFVLALSITLPLPSARALTQSEVVDCLIFIHDRATTDDGTGALIRKAGWQSAKIGLSLAGVGAYLQFTGTKNGLTALMIGAGSRALQIALPLMGVGVVVSMLEPTPVEPATIADGFRTAEGLGRFFRLPLEHQIQIASGDRGFAKLVVAVADQVKQVETELQRNRNGVGEPLVF